MLRYPKVIKVIEIHNKIFLLYLNCLQEYWSTKRNYDGREFRIQIDDSKLNCIYCLSCDDQTASKHLTQMKRVYFHRALYIRTVPFKEKEIFSDQSWMRRLNLITNT